uniref:Translation initiation factor eIF2B subunit beta n=1 Tax=Plectus sambesii TaxID=2011161 RepID=A0A914UNG6_9BILA
MAAADVDAISASARIGKIRDQFIVDLRQGRIRGTSYHVAQATVNFMRKLVANCKYDTYDELLTLLKTEGRAVTAAEPTEFVVGNMVLRILKLVREEQTRLILGSDDVALADPADALHKLWKAPEVAQKEIATKQLRKATIETINEFLQEMENSRDNISSQAADHILDGDVVFTFGQSVTVDAFLKVAATKRRFTVFIGENAPSCNGKALLESLKSDEKCSWAELRLVEDTDVLPSMPQVTRVVVGAVAVLADGGFVASAGTLTLCLAAKRHAIPVIVCAAFYKLTPKFLSANDQEQFNKLLSPSSVLPFSQASSYGGADVICPLFDYIPPELVTLYIPQTFGIAPSHVYRLLGEYFHPEDIEHNL